MDAYQKKSTQEELKADLAARVPGLEGLAEIPGVVPGEETPAPGPGEAGFEAAFGRGAVRPVQRREFWLALLFLLCLGAIPLRHGLASADQVVFGMDQALTSMPWRPAVETQVELQEHLQNRGLSDQSYNLYPFYRWVSRSYLSGDLPFWNPLIYLGAPALGNPQSGVLDPQVGLLVLGEALGGIKGFHYCMTLAALGRLVLAGLGAYLLARRLGLGARGALLAGLGFQFSGYMVLWLNFPLAHVPPFLPWLLYFLEGLWGRGPGETSPWPRRRAFLGAALCMALAILGGHPETSFFVGLAAGVWALVICLRDRRAGLLALGALGLGSLLASPLLIAFWGYLSVSGAKAERMAEQKHVALNLAGLLAIALLVGLVYVTRRGLLGLFEGERKNLRSGARWTPWVLVLGLGGVSAGGLLWFLGAGLGERFFLSFIHDLWGQPGVGDGFVGPGTGLLENASTFLLSAVFLGALGALFSRGCLRRRGLVLGLGAVSLGLAVGLPGLVELYRQVPLVGLGSTIRFAPVAALMLSLLAGECLESGHFYGRLAGFSCMASMLGVLLFLGGRQPVRPLDLEAAAPQIGLELGDKLHVYQRPGERFAPRIEKLEGWFVAPEVTHVRLQMVRLEATPETTQERDSQEVPLDILATPRTQDPAGSSAPDGARYFRSSVFQTGRLAEGWWQMRLDFMVGERVLASESLGASLMLRSSQSRPLTLFLIALASAAFLIGRRAAPALIAISAIQALAFAEGQNPHYPAAAVFPETATERILLRELGPHRYFSELGILPPDTGLVRGFAGLGGYDAIDPATYNAMRPFALLPGGHPVLTWHARGVDLTSPVFQSLGVKCLVFHGPMGSVGGAEGWELIACPPRKAGLAGLAPGAVEAAETWIYRARNPWPRAWCVVESIGVEAVRRDFASWDPRQTAILMESWEPVAPVAGQLEVSLPKITNNTTTVDVQVDGEALLIISDQFFASSYFEVDGERRQARAVNSIFCGVELHAGDRQVVLWH